MFPGSVEISQRLAEIGEYEGILYRSALDFHYSLWKWQRISEVASLSFLRRMLAEHGLVESNPDPGWIVNRGAAAYRDLLGEGYAQQLESLQLKALSGHVPHDELSRIFDSGSGNGTACYELARPNLLIIGSGLSLHFAVDGTLRNWLREPFRASRLQWYRSTIAARAFKLAEIWSVAHFVAPTPVDDFDPIAELDALCVDGTASSGKLLDLARRTEERLATYGTQDANGRGMATAVALGFLVDALAGRVRFPNGVQFSYPDSALWAESVVSVLNLVESDPIRTDVSARLVALAPQCEELAARIRRHLEDPSLRADVDDDFVGMLPELADAFKATAFELRDRDGNVTLIEALHGIGNELWRWHFFVSDLKTWSAATKPARSARSSAPIVRAWLERPWGALRPKDMSWALAESFAPPAGRPPRLLSPLTPLLRDGVDKLIDDGFGAVPRVAERLMPFIVHRCRLCDTRAAMEWVSHEDQDDNSARDRELADLLVELLTVWFYDQPERAREEIIESGLRPLADKLDEASWLDALPLPSISRRQARLMGWYRNDPKGTVEALFEFQAGTDLLDRLDVYPTEEFWFQPRI